MKKLLSLLMIATMMLFMVGCSDTEDVNVDVEGDVNVNVNAETDVETNAELIANDVDGELIFVETMELEYADQFTVDLYQGGYKIITTVIQEGTEFLIVPEGKTVPADLAENVVVIEQSFENIRLSAVSYPYFFDALGAMDMVSSVAHEADYWYLDSLIDAFAAGDITYTGTYSTPDYELITANGTELVFDNYSVYSKTDVLDKYEELGIPVIIDGSYKEGSPLAKVEWVKLVGAVLGLDEEAQAYFTSQVDLIESVSSDDPTGKTAAVFYLSLTSDKVYARNGGDYQATMVGLAGGEYIMQDYEADSTGIATLTFEDFYANNINADYIFYTISGHVETIDDLLDYYPLLADFKAVQDGNVYVVLPNFSAAVTELSLVIEDMHKVMVDPDDDTITNLVKLQ